MIDGQQRLTTFEIFLAALREVGSRIGAAEIATLVRNYLYLPKMEGDTSKDSKYRLIPTPEDRTLFHLIVDKGLDGIKATRRKALLQER